MTDDRSISLSHTQLWVHSGSPLYKTAERGAFGEVEAFPCGGVVRVTFKRRLPGLYRFWLHVRADQVPLRHLRKLWRWWRNGGAA